MVLWEGQGRPVRRGRGRILVPIFWHIFKFILYGLLIVNGRFRRTKNSSYSYPSNISHQKYSRKRVYSIFSHTRLFWQIVSLWPPLLKYKVMFWPWRRHFQAKRKQGSSEKIVQKLFLWILILFYLMSCYNIPWAKICKN